MERITEAQLSRVLSGTLKPSTPQLSKTAKAFLVAGIKQVVTAYPSQDLSASLPAWLDAFERLAVKYSVIEVTEALRELLITPGQAFFPRPDEVASEILRAREVRAERHRTARWDSSEIQEWKREWQKCREEDERNGTQIQAVQP
jgi:hypothetical protein